MLFDHLICPNQQRLRKGDTDRLGGFQVDRQLEFCRLLDGKVRRLGAL
jgi:hypothetical protein